MRRFYGHCELHSFTKYVMYRCTGFYKSHGHIPISQYKHPLLAGLRILYRCLIVRTTPREILPIYRQLVRKGLNIILPISFFHDGLLSIIPWIPLSDVLLPRGAIDAIYLMDVLFMMMNYRAFFFTV